VFASAIATTVMAYYWMHRPWKLSPEVIPHEWFDEKRISKGGRYGIALMLIRHRAFSNVTRDEVVRVLGTPDGIDDNGPNVVYWVGTKRNLFLDYHAILEVKFDQSGRSQIAHIRYD
jgi:hypothetical protein